MYETQRDKWYISLYVGLNVEIRVGSHNYVCGDKGKVKSIDVYAKRLDK